MRTVAAKRVVKTVSTPTQQLMMSVASNAPSHSEDSLDFTDLTEIRDSSFSDIEIQESEIEQSPCAVPMTEADSPPKQPAGSLLSVKKRSCSFTLKSMPNVTIADGYAFKAVKSFREHSDFITKVKLYRDSTSKLLSVGNDGMLIQYDLSSGSVTKRKIHRSGITDFDISRQNRYLLTSSLNGIVKLWALSRTLQKPIAVHQIGNRANAVCFNPKDISQFVVGDAKGRVLLYSGDAKEGVVISTSNSALLTRWISTAQSPVEPINALVFSSTGRFLFSGDGGGTLCVYEQTNNKFQLVQSINLRSAITGLAYCDRTEKLLVSSCDHKARLFSCPSLELCRVFFHQQGTHSCKAAFSPDSKFVIIASEDFHIHLFDIESGQLLNKWEAHSTVVSSIDVECINSTIISSSFGGDITVWKLSE